MKEVSNILPEKVFLIIYLQIIPPRLLEPPVGVDAHVADGADEVLGLCIVHVSPGGVPEGLGQPEVHHVDLAAVVQAEHAVLGICDTVDLHNFRLSSSYLWFDISVDQPPRVYLFEPRQELQPDHGDRLGSIHI